MNTDISPLYTLPIPDHSRGFFDPVKTREWSQAGVLRAFQNKLNKIETPDFKLQVTNIHIPDPHKHFSYEDQKKAIFEKGDLTLPIKGHFQMIDKRSGAVVDEKTTTIAHLPFITDRNTVVYNGGEYFVTNQQRLKPGVYHRVKESGEVEAHVNVKSGTGIGGKLVFDAEKAVFTYYVGTTGIKLYGLLRDLGVSDTEMQQAWGEEVFLKNKETYDGKELDKFYAKVFKFEKEPLTPKPEMLS